MHTRDFSKKEWQDSVGGHNCKTQKRHCTADYKISWVGDQEENGAAKGSEQLVGRVAMGYVCTDGAGQQDLRGSLLLVTLGLPCHSPLPSFCSTHTFSTLPYLSDSTAVFSICLGRFFTFHQILSLFFLLKE